MEFYPIHFDKLNSTNDYSTQLVAKSNPIEGTVISTYNQLSGNGQIGRKWFSDVNNNITCSIILTPNFLSIDKVFYLNIILSLAVHSLVTNISFKEFKIKWPNDIYFENDKIAGLLIQQIIQGKSLNTTIMGVGLNVNQVIFPPDLPNPTSLFLINQQEYDLDKLLTEFLNELGIFYERLKNREFINLKKEYLNNLYGRGELHQFQSKEQVFEGEILGIDKNGRLSINKNGKVENFELNDIRLLLGGG